MFIVFLLVSADSAAVAVLPAAALPDLRRLRLFLLYGPQSKGGGRDNGLEYFAELTAMYFLGVDYFPKDRAGLQTYDAAGYALVEKLWGIRGDPVPVSTHDTRASQP